MTEQNQAGYVDVTLFMDDEHVTNWKGGRWKGKVTMHTFAPWIQAKATELGRKVSTEETDAFVESTKDADLDVPLTREQIKERFHGKKTLADIPATRLGDQWLYQQKLGGMPAKKNRRMEEEKVALAERLGRQIVLQQVQNLFGKIAEGLALEAFGPDTVEGYSTGQSIPCTLDGCSDPLHAMKRTITRNDRVVMHEEGHLLAGRPKRVGNFAVVAGKEGPEIVALCEKHCHMFVKAGRETFPFEDAVALIEAMKVLEELKKAEEARKKEEEARKKEREEARKKELEAIKKLAESCPAVALKQKYQDVRRTRDTGRADKKKARRQEE